MLVSWCRRCLWSFVCDWGPQKTEGADDWWRIWYWSLYDLALIAVAVERIQRSMKNQHGKCPHGRMVLMTFSGFDEVEWNYRKNNLSLLLLLSVPAGSPSRGGDVTFHVWHKPTDLAHSFLFCSCVYFCFCVRFNCISFHKFFRQLSAFSLCSSGLISALLVLWTIQLFMKVSLSPGRVL